jgi:hypothetical protein
MSVAAYAQCSPGTILYHTPTNSYCGPDPSYAPPQQSLQQPEVWQRRYGALVVDTQSGVLGVAANMRSRSAATEAAMDDCKDQGGTNCVLENSYSNGCTALVTADRGFSFDTNRMVQGAIDGALKRCADFRGVNCRLVYQGCSLPVRTR